MSSNRGSRQDLLFAASLAAQVLTNNNFVVSSATMETVEKITHEAGNPEAWKCICGNTPDSGGFYPCDAQGNEMEPVKGWKELYVCDDCGRIIHQDTLEVVGRRVKSK
jgi:hypothetical protein